MESAIREFWQYAAEHIAEVDLGQLRQDLPLINQSAEDPMQYVFNLTPSGLIYLQLILKSRAICKDIHPMIGMQIIPMEDSDLLRLRVERPPELTPEEANKAKKCLLRIMINITADGNYEVFPIVEQFYNISKEFNLGDDILITKFVPAQEGENLMIPMSQVMLSSVMFQYRVHLIPGTTHDLDLVAVLDDNVAQAVIKTQDDVQQLRNGMFCALETLIGEYATATYIKRLTVIPALLHRRNFHNHEKDLQPMSNIARDLALLLPETKKCELCRIADTNTTLEKVEDLDIRAGLYCPYCAAVLRRLVR